MLHLLHWCTKWRNNNTQWLKQLHRQSSNKISHRCNWSLTNPNTFYDHEKRVRSASLVLVFGGCFFSSCSAHRLFSMSDRTAVNSWTMASKSDPTDSYACSAVQHRLSSRSVSATDLSNSDLCQTNMTCQHKWVILHELISQLPAKVRSCLADLA